MTKLYNSLISTDELSSIIEQPHVKIFDASIGIDPDIPFPHIKGAQYFDIDQIADQSSPFSHTVPSPDFFEDKIRDLGINKGDQIIVYDKTGVAMAACRVWWLFRLFGHDNVAILNGGLPAWARNGGDIEDTPTDTVTTKGNFTSNFRPDLLRNATEVKSNIDSGQDTVIDARSPDRFVNRIPNSYNLFFMALLNHDGSFKSDDDIRRLTAECNINLDDNLVTSCGSGITACVLALALFRLGKTDVAVYDGSWTEWTNLGYPMECAA